MMEHWSLHRTLSVIVLSLVATCWFAGTAGALEDHEWMYPAYDTGFDGGDHMIADSTYRMHASDQSLFILQTWFAAALSMCEETISIEDAWQGWYFNKDYPYQSFVNPTTGNDTAGLFCHTGSLEFVFDTAGSFYDDVTYHPLTWGQHWDESLWGYQQEGSQDQEENLFWYDTLTGLPVIHVTETAMEGVAGEANIGHLYFWPYAGVTGDWDEAVGIIEEGYYCTQDDGHSCWKDVLVYEGNSAYTVRAYYVVYDGVDSDHNWDDELHPDNGSPLNDFNILWTPGTSIPEFSYIVLSNEVNNECACDLDSRWHHTDPTQFAPSVCDVDIENFDEPSDYSSGLAFLRAMDLCDEDVSNISLQHHGFGYGIDYDLGVTDGGSIGIRTDYGTSMPPRNGDRIAIMSTGDIGGNTQGMSGFSGEWWSYSSTTGYIDYALPDYKRLCEDAMCCTQTERRYDVTTIEFDILVPEGAEGVSYDVAFFTQEYPEWAGTYYNDGFEAVFEDPKVADWVADPDFTGYGCDGDGDGVSEANVAYDDTGTPLRVNNHFISETDCSTFDNIMDHNGHVPQATIYDPDWTYSGYQRCCGWSTGTFERTCDVPNWWAQYYPDTCPPFGVSFGHYGLCGGGYGEDSGGTRWLTNTFGVTAGRTMHVRFSIYDKSDGIFDTTVLLDNWIWMGQDPGSPVLYEPPTTAFVGSPN